MADKIDYIKDRRGRKRFPITHEKGVRDSNWVRLEEKLKGIEAGKQDTSNKVTSLSPQSTDTQYPSAKAVVDYVDEHGGGGTGIDTVNVTVDNTSGNPSGSGSVSGSTLNLSFSGLKGATGATGATGPQGNTGSSVDYPFELANNLTTDDSMMALTAAQGVVLHGDDFVLQASKLDKALGKNLYDDSKAQEGLLKSDGTIGANASWVYTPFILVEAGVGYYIHCENRNGLNAGSYICFYTKDQIFLSSITADNASFTTPANCGFIRFGYPSWGYNKVMLEKGSSASSYEPYDETAGLLGDIKFSLTRKLDFNAGSNLYDKSADTLGYYINNSGALGQNGNYNASDYIPVNPQASYYISQNGDAAVSDSAQLYHAFYNSSKSLISLVASTTKSVTTPAGTAFMRLTLRANADKVMVTPGNQRVEYCVYSPISGYLPILREHQVDYDNLNESLQAKINARSSFQGFTNSGSVAAGNAITTAVCHVEKNTLLSARIVGAIEKIYVGVGKTDSSFGSSWLEIDSTTVVLYQNMGSAAVEGTYQHGLTLNGDLVVDVDSRLSGKTIVHTLRLQNGLGDLFEQVIPAWGYGKPFVENANASAALTVKLSYMARDITKKIWLFGDSYAGIDYNGKWPYYFKERELTDWLINSLPGQNPTNAYTDLSSILSLGFIPTYLFWTLGMNGGSDTGSSGSYTIPSAQKAVIDNVVSLCHENGIIPVFATIPTVPSQQKTGYSNYIRSLGERYVDFAEAVGATESGEWNTGLQSSDHVHPTAAGSRVLAERVLLDFPEIAIND